MIRKYFIPVLALAGVVFAVFTVLRGDTVAPQQPPVMDAAQAPYPNAVAGSGIIESSTENICISAQIGGVVSKVFVKAGSDVKAGDALFAIDERALLAEAASRRAAVQVAEAQLADAKYVYALVDGLTSKGNASVKDRERDRFAEQKAEAQLAQARADLNMTGTNLECLTIRAPVDGQVLQLKLHAGEFATAGILPQGQALLLLGSVTPLHVRVDVDENDASRIVTNAAATGFIRGNTKIKIPLKFVRFEPYIVPKKSLTGDTTERVDTRVLQVIYSFDRNDLPIFVGQQMDVFIEAGGGFTDTSSVSPKKASNHLD